MLKGKFLKGAIISATLLWLLFTLFYLSNQFERAENILYDGLYQNVSEPDTRIVIIGIDEDSIARLGQWPWPRTAIAEVIEMLAEGGAAAIGVDVEYDTPGREQGEDDRLAGAIENAGNVVLPVRGLFKHRTVQVTNGLMQADELIMPLESFQSAKLAHVNGLTESDGVVRRALLDLSYDGSVYTSFAYALYDTARESLALPDLTGEIPVDAASRYDIVYTGRAGWYHPLSFADVYEGKVPPRYFKDKIVLIGLYAHGVARDWQFTSIDGERLTYGVEIHANITQQLIEGNFLRHLSLPVGFVLFACLTLLSAALFIYIKPRPGLLILIAMTLIQGCLVFWAVRSGVVTLMTYSPVFIIVAYFTMLIWHYAQTRANESRVRDTFGRYMAPSIIKKILEDGDEGLMLRGQRRRVTILFVDIRGFTTMSETTQPEEVVEMLNMYLDLVATCVHRHGGTLDKFIGDAAMAIWNAPYDTEDFTMAAVQAALDMRSESAALGEKLLEKHGRTLQFGIGINSGDAVIGNIGASFRMDYTAIGDSVNTAARLESNAKPGQILVSRAVVDNLDDGVVSAKHIGGLKVKGRDEEVQVYEL